MYKVQRSALLELQSGPGIDPGLTVVLARKFLVSKPAMMGSKAFSAQQQTQN